MSAPLKAHFSWYGECRACSGPGFLTFVFVIYFICQDNKILFHFFCPLQLAASWFGDDDMVFVLVFPDVLRDIGISPSILLEYRQNLTLGGILERAPGAPFSLPFLYSTIKLNCCNLSDHLIRWQELLWFHCPFSGSTRLQDLYHTCQYRKVWIWVTQDGWRDQNAFQLVKGMLTCLTPDGRSCFLF